MRTVALNLALLATALVAGACSMGSPAPAGGPAPPLGDLVAMQDGAAPSLTAQAGRLRLVEFWATW